MEVKLKQLKQRLLHQQIEIQKVQENKNGGHTVKRQYHLDKAAEINAEIMELESKLEGEWS